MKMTKKEAKKIEEIAKQYIYAIEARGGLEARNNDDEDFFETSVWSLEAALKAAYEAGKNSK